MDYTALAKEAKEAVLAAGFSTADIADAAAYNIAVVDVLRIIVEAETKLKVAGSTRKFGGREAGTRTF